MNAIILAAGFGTRLGDLTKSTPKCLIEVAGKPMLLHVIERLRSVGVEEIVINTHYLAVQVHDFVNSLNFPDTKITLSHENQILGTGGGIKQASTFFSEFKDTYIYNADTLSNLDLNYLRSEHERLGSMVSIACQDIYVPRHLLFDSNDRFLGWANDTVDHKVILPGAITSKRGHYLCVQMISASVLKYFEEFSGEFILFDPYLKAAAAGEAVRAVWFDELSWHDIGTPEDLAKARADG